MILDNFDTSVDTRVSEHIVQNDLYSNYKISYPSCILNTKLAFKSSHPLFAKFSHIPSPSPKSVSPKDENSDWSSDLNMDSKNGPKVYMNKIFKQNIQLQTPSNLFTYLQRF